MATFFAAFADIGTPAEGLSATIRIRRADTQALVVTDSAMTEQGDGGYSFVFSPVDGIDYSVRADGGTTLSDSDRFVFGSISGATEATEDQVARIHKHLGLLPGTPAVHTPTSITAGPLVTTIGVVGSTITKTTA